MAERGVEQRLAAILAADVAGYTRLMAADERATIDALNRCRAIFRGHITAHGGRVVDMAGDSVLAIFGTAIGTARAALAAQEAIARENAGLPEGRRMSFRIGLNTGDIHEQDDGTIYGDGVNIAARLEGLAPPGGVSVSGKFHDEIRGKLDIGFEDIGEHDVKNVDGAVHAYLMVEAGLERRTGFAPLRKARILLSAGVAVVAVALVVGGWWLTREPPKPAMLTAEGVPTDDPVLAMPSGPSIAVLPFDNLSRDPEHEYFVDGLTEEIIAALSRFSHLTVISRNSTFRYKGKAVDVRTVGKELGARYLVEGSIRRSADSIRITTQLIDVETDGHLWSETFDRTLTPQNVFAIQDEITATIASTIGDTYGVITMSERRHVGQNRATHLEGYDCVLRAIDHVRWLRLETHGPARDCLEVTVAADPDYAQAWGWLSWLYVEEYSQHLNPRPGSLDRALEAAERAIRLAPRDGQLYVNLANVHYFRDEREAFLAASERALELNPNDASIVAWMGHRYGYAGLWERGLALIEKAEAMNPYHPGWYHFVPYFHEYRNENYEAALAVAQRMNMPGYVWAQAALAAAYGQLGRTEDAAPIVARMLELKPDIAASARESRYRIMRYQPDLIEHFLEGLRKAGLDIPR